MRRVRRLLRQMRRDILGEVRDLLNERNQRLQNELSDLLNQTVEITTRDGTVQGTLVSVGNDFAEILGADGNIVLIPFENLISFSSI
ncbi:hypothetical protein [Desmospora profundinema]|uniref:DUF2642 domain-containing protein n=1 Tax=Desmospora profundinema TaxID=1571184 RepID=A0ABU1IHT8_9BACL|nr:hypothetical protein [Desmospora profundinema]MDR6224336.1 hypothetical protein [Desmospora profundinema]